MAILNQLVHHFGPDQNPTTIGWIPMNLVYIHEWWSDDKPPFTFLHLDISPASRQDMMLAVNISDEHDF